MNKRIKYDLEIIYFESNFSEREEKLYIIVYNVTVVVNECLIIAMYPWFACDVIKIQNTE